MNTKISQESRINAVVSYVFVFSVVLYIINKEDKFVQFHAKQGIIIAMIMLVGFIPVLGVPFLLLSFVLSIIGASKAYIGEEFKIPFVFKYAQKIDF